MNAEINKSIIPCSHNIIVNMINPNPNKDYMKEIERIVFSFIVYFSVSSVVICFIL